MKSRRGGGGGGTLVTEVPDLQEVGDRFHGGSASCPHLVAPNYKCLPETPIVGELHRQATTQVWLR